MRCINWEIIDGDDDDNDDDADDDDDNNNNNNSNNIANNSNRRNALFIWSRNINSWSVPDMSIHGGGHFPKELFLYLTYSIHVQRASVIFTAALQKCVFCFVLVKIFFILCKN